MIIGWRHAGTNKECKEFPGVAFCIEESIAQVDCLGMNKRGSADGLQAAAQGWNHGSGFLAREIA